jgi:prolyl-tRNA editing enzyme YbaK/EbsC (Cys-tRNA(Pro) deacylase)
MSQTSPIHEFLRAARIAYDVVPSEETQAAAVVVYFVDEEPVQVVFPAAMAVNLDGLLALVRGRVLRRADDTEVRRLFPGHEPGALPPFGQSQGRPVFVDVALASARDIVFAAGVGDSIAVRWADFAATVRPIVGRFAEPPRDRVGEFRLSYRE